MIEFKNVKFSYSQKTVLENFSLKINSGEHVCIFGESGSGKTTLLRLLIGLEKPDSGVINGVTGKKFSVVFQENRLLNWKNVLENVTIAGDRIHAQQLLERLGLGQWEQAQISDLSGGMRRRVAIARALCAEFDVLVLDEPFNGLDEERVEATAQLICEIAMKRTVVLVTHNKAHAVLLGARTENIN